ncbi:MAG TPA: tetratricopeptide repeat protein [Pyrinomonadaceae bacterium]|nr:tetratricopeptide repeat protein [Pyrinomonadaceae bacterium]
MAGNPLGQEFCARCGTRLMIVVEPRAARYEVEDESASEQGDHLLERVSALEYRLLRLTERLEQALDLMLRQAHNSYFDHALLETLISLLSETGAIDAESLRRLWQERCDKDSAQQDLSNRRDEVSRKIISQYRGPEQAAFAKFVKEGISLLADDEVSRGIRLLERATLIARDNLPLLVFIGEHFFLEGQMALARDYLSRAFEFKQDDVGICLLLGLACGDEGEAERARELLESAAQMGRASFAAHYGLGRLSVAAERWTDALASFKRALAARPCAEAHYVVASVYYKLSRDRMAARHLRKALEMDEEYAAAHYTLGLVQLRGGEAERARESFEAARAASGNEPRYRNGARRMLRPEDVPAVPPLFVVTQNARKRLITSGDKRLAELLREDALSKA